MTLVLSSEELSTLLADNIQLVQGLFRTLAERSTARDRLVVRGEAGTDISRLTTIMSEESASAGERLLTKGARSAEVARLAAGGLTPVQRIIVLGRIPLFSRISVEELLHLAAITREVSLVAEDILTNEADEPALFVVLAGEVSLEAPAAVEGEAPPLDAGPGDAIGIFERNFLV